MAYLCCSCATFNGLVNFYVCLLYSIFRNETSANLLGVSEEARIRADRETQESWEVILNNNIPDVTDQDQLVFFEVLPILMKPNICISIIFGTFI